jgi:hypothetical protein
LLKNNERKDQFIILNETENTCSDQLENYFKKFHIFDSIPDVGYTILKGQWAFAYKFIDPDAIKDGN